MSFVIAIDGPAASGKGTLSRKLAAHLGFDRLDTGRLYRATGYLVLQKGKDPSDEGEAVSAAQELAGLIPENYLEKPELYSDEAGIAASKVAKIQAVRDALFDFQRDFAFKALKGAILDGRDIGTVICPEADIKLYVTASLEERAKRRFAELQSRGEGVPFETVLEEMRNRDVRDQTRDAAPLKPADDAILVDTTGKNIDQVFDFVISVVEKQLEIR